MSLRVRLALTVLLTSIPLAAGLSWFVQDLERKAIEAGLRDMIVTRMESGERDRCEESPETYGGGSFGRDPRRRSRRSGRDRSRPRRPRHFDGPPLEVWAYDSSFQSANPAAPPIPAAMQAALSGGKQSASSWHDLEPRSRSEPRPESRSEPRSESRSEPRPESRSESRSEPRPESRSEPRQRPGPRPRPRPGGGSEGPAAIDPIGRPESPSVQRIDMVIRMDWDEGPCAVLFLRQRRIVDAVGFLGLHWSSLVVAGAALLAVLLAAGPPVRRIRQLTDEVRVSAADRYSSEVEVRGRDEIAGLATAFNDAGAQIRSQLEKLERREEALRSFLGNTTHDVMVPLTVLQGHLTRLRRDLDGSTAVDPSTLVAALDETQYIASLLHNLGAAAKLEGSDSDVRSDPVMLNDLVERAVARYRPLAQAHDIEINSATPEDPTRTLGDVTLLEQALSNVIHNAVRYNRTGGHVAVILQRGSDRFSLKVVDDGPGIPPDELAKLPERRFRGEEARTRHPEGRGLGLNIARDVAARHEIDLALRESEYGGLEVEFSGALAPAD